MSTGTSVCGELTGIGTVCVCLSVLLFCGELTGIGKDCVCLSVLLFVEDKMSLGRTAYV